MKKIIVMLFLIAPVHLVRGAALPVQKDSSVLFGRLAAVVVRGCADGYLQWSRSSGATPAQRINREKITQLIREAADGVFTASDPRLWNEGSGFHKAACVTRLVNSCAAVRDALNVAKIAHNDPDVISRHTHQPRGQRNVLPWTAMTTLFDILATLSGNAGNEPTFFNNFSNGLARASDTFKTMAESETVGKLEKKLLIASRNRKGLSCLLECAGSYVAPRGDNPPLRRRHGGPPDDDGHGGGGVPRPDEDHDGGPVPPVVNGLGRAAGRRAAVWHVAGDGDVVPRPDGAHDDGPVPLDVGRLDAAVVRLGPDVRPADVREALAYDFRVIQHHVDREMSREVLDADIELAYRPRIEAIADLAALNLFEQTINDGCAQLAREVARLDVCIQQAVQLYPVAQLGGAYYHEIRVGVGGPLAPDMRALRDRLNERRAVLVVQMPPIIAARRQALQRALARAGAGAPVVPVPVPALVELDAWEQEAPEAPVADGGAVPAAGGAGVDPALVLFREEWQAALKRARPVGAVDARKAQEIKDKTVESEYAGALQALERLPHPRVTPESLPGERIRLSVIDTKQQLLVELHLISEEMRRLNRLKKDAEGLLAQAREGREEKDRWGYVIRRTPFSAELRAQAERSIPAAIDVINAQLRVTRELQEYAEQQVVKFGGGGAAATSLSREADTPAQRIQKTILQQMKDPMSSMLMSLLHGQLSPAQLEQADIRASCMNKEVVAVIRLLIGITDDSTSIRDYRRATNTQFKLGVLAMPVKPVSAAKPAPRAIMVDLEGPPTADRLQARNNARRLIDRYKIQEGFWNTLVERCEYPENYLNPALHKLHGMFNPKNPLMPESAYEKAHVVLAALRVRIAELQEKLASIRRAEEEPARRRKEICDQEELHRIMSLSPAVREAEKEAVIHDLRAELATVKDAAGKVKKPTKEQIAAVELSPAAISYRLRLYIKAEALTARPEEVVPVSSNELTAEEAGKLKELKAAFAQIAEEDESRNRLRDDLMCAWIRTNIARIRTALAARSRAAAVPRAAVVAALSAAGVSSERSVAAVAVDAPVVGGCGAIRREDGGWADDVPHGACAAAAMALTTDQQRDVDAALDLYESLISSGQHKQYLAILPAWQRAAVEAEIVRRSGPRAHGVPSLHGKAAGGAGAGAVLVHDGDGGALIADPAAAGYDEDAVLQAALTASALEAELMRIAARSPGASSSDDDWSGGGAAAVAAGAGRRR